MGTSSARGTANVPAQQLIDDVRRARFRSARAACPRCKHRRFHRWGSFSGRQRYRCQACRRTFSDLTGTPMAYSKRLELWPRYVPCFLRSLPVRETGHRVGINKDTALRWRHRLLAAHRRREDRSITGDVEVLEIRLPHSYKGRRLSYTYADRPDPRGYLGNPPKDRVLLLHVRQRGVTLEAHLRDAPVIGALTPDFFTEALLPRLIRPCAMLIDASNDSGLAGFCAEAGVRIAQIRSAARVRGYHRRFRSWLGRFYGVATRYLSNYFCWHRLLERLRAVRGLRKARPPLPRSCYRQVLLAACRL